MFSESRETEIQAMTNPTFPFLCTWYIHIHKHVHRHTDSYIYTSHEGSDSIIVMISKLQKSRQTDQHYILVDKDDFRECTKSIHSLGEWGLLLITAAPSIFHLSWSSHPLHEKRAFKYIPGEGRVLQIKSVHELWYLQSVSMCTLWLHARRQAMGGDVVRCS